MLCLLPEASDLYSCFFYEDKGPREVVSLCFTGLKILLSGLGGHAEDLLAVSIKMFTRRLSGLALLPSCRTIFMYLLPLKHVSPPSVCGVCCSPALPAWPSPRRLKARGARGAMRLLTVSLPHSLSISQMRNPTVEPSDLPGPPRESGVAVRAQVCSPPKNVLLPDPHPCPFFPAPSVTSLRVCKM